MSPYQHLFSTNAVLNVWRNLRQNRGDPNDLLLTLQYQPDEVRKKRFGGSKRDGANGHGTEVEATTAVEGGTGGQGRSIGFVVPWRSMQAQKQELREKEKELAEALVVLAGEVAFTDLSSTLQTSLSTSPLIQTRHICAGLSRQISKIELQMADNAPFCHGKNLYTGGEIARKFLPPIERLFEQRPVPQRMIFELLMELKDIVFSGMADCDEETGEWEAEGFNTFEELDELVVRSLMPLSPEEMRPKGLLRPQSQPEIRSQTENPARRFLKRKPSTLLQQHTPQSQPRHLSKSSHPIPDPWTTTTATPHLLYILESLETTSSAMSHLSPRITDFLAASSLTLRRMLDRRTLNDFALSKRKRTGRCAEYARCMKWAGTNWRQGGGCRRGCKDEDEDPEGLPSWHRSSRWFQGDKERGFFKLGDGGNGRGLMGEEHKGLGRGTG